MTPLCPRCGAPLQPLIGDSDRLWCARVGRRACSWEGRRDDPSIRWKQRKISRKTGVWRFLLGGRS